MRPVQPISNVPSCRATRLKKRFLDVLSGSVKIDPQGAPLFLEGLCAQDDPVACLSAIFESPHGLSAVNSALWFDLSPKFMNGLGSTVLAYLLRASQVGGDTLDNILFHVVEPPIFWAAFVRAFQQGELTKDAQLVFGKLLSRLMTLRNRDTTPYRNVAVQHSVHDILILSSEQEMREIGHFIKYILSNNGSLSVYDTGPRHDNDFSDFHDIAILPTADEIICQKPPILRTAFENEHHTSETPFNDYLDNAFRMLREDMLFEIRQQVQASSQEKRMNRVFRDLGGVSMVGIYTGTGNRRTQWSVKLQCNTDFEELKKFEDKKARIAFLGRDQRGLNILRHQSLICLTGDQDIVSFGTVHRVEDLLASDPPVVVLHLDGKVNIRKTLASLSTADNLRLVQLNAATFSFEPVLTALQKTLPSPLATEIILWDPEKDILAHQKHAALSHVADAIASNLSVDLKSLMDLPTSIRLDDSQARSLITGLTKPVSLIQGPPGTGKSFIGTILAKTIHDKTRQTILVVCYTNHALDQFLGDLLKYGIPAKSMLRLGSRVNQSMEHLSLHKQPRVRFRYDWDGINALRRAAEGEEGSLEHCFDKLIDIQDDRNLMSHLELQHRDFFEAFNVPLETEDGMIRVGKNGKAIDEDYLFSRWTRGLDAGVLSGDPHVQASARIWGMDHSARQQLLAEWRHERVTEATESACEAGLEYNRVQDKIKEKFAESTVAILRQKRIIACTTTGAAMNTEVIGKAGPEVLLVEEAGEILESHILTALSRKVERVILIGDHKQLRPKVNDYRLTVEKGDGFDLNRSLFERLVLKGYPHETLSTQHRMRPEISTFVRQLTYPELVDAPSTRKRPDVRGVLSNVIFIDHDHPEDDDALVSDRSDGGASTSKRNTYEVQMVLSVVRYFVQQGYKAKDIVVLTPYLGQLYQLRDALKREVDPILNELDASDLARAGIATSAQPELKAKNQIHLATIDNYQGEESPIVVASMTRSNKSNSIGFMDSPERLNVLLSRARDGLVLIGNSRTFLHSKKGGTLWRKFFALIEEGRYAYRGFPIKCERHPERVALLGCASDFGGRCPDGGCTEPCGFTLSCGHVCPKRCHPRRPSALLDPHDATWCKEKMSATCQAGRHKLVWECRSGRPSDCSACAEEARRLEEMAREALELQRKREEAEAEYRRRMAELEAELQQKREEAEEGRKRQEQQYRQEEEQKRKMEEEEMKREEERKKQEEKKKKQQEKKMRREERKRRYDEEKRAREAQQLHETTLQTEEEERIRTREEKARRLLEATLEQCEEQEKKITREEQTEKLSQAACRRRKEDERRRRDEESRNRVVQTKRLQEAACRRLEEAEHQKQEEARRKREEETERLQEATRKRCEEEQRRREEEIRQREEELVKRIQEATARRHEEKQQRLQEEGKRSREEQAKRLLQASCRRQVAKSEQPSVHMAGVEGVGRPQILRHISKQLQGCKEDEENVERYITESEPNLQVDESTVEARNTLDEQEALRQQGEERKRQMEERKRQDKMNKRAEKKRRREEVKKTRKLEKGERKGKEVQGK